MDTTNPIDSTNPLDPTDPVDPLTPAGPGRGGGSRAAAARWPQRAPSPPGDPRVRQVWAAAGRGSPVPDVGGGRHLPHRLRRAGGGGGPRQLWQRTPGSIHGGGRKTWVQLRENFWVQPGGVRVGW